MSSTRREVGAAVLLCLVGAFLVLVGAGRSWATVAVAASDLLPARSVGVTGSDLAPGLQALGLVGLAGVVAVAATRGWGRLAVGLLLLVAGAGVVALAVAASTDLAEAALTSDPVREAGGGSGEVARTAWPLVTGLGGALLALAGVLVAGRGRRWAGLGQRYEAPSAREGAAPAATAAPTERALWESLDRGEDPTAPEDGSPDTVSPPPDPRPSER